MLGSLHLQADSWTVMHIHCWHAGHWQAAVERMAGEGRVQLLLEAAVAEAGGPGSGSDGVWR